MPIPPSIITVPVVLLVLLVVFENVTGIVMSFDDSINLVELFHVIIPFKSGADSLNATGSNLLTIPASNLEVSSLYTIRKFSRVPLSTSKPL